MAQILDSAKERLQELVIAQSMWFVYTAVMQAGQQLGHNTCYCLLTVCTITCRVGKTAMHQTGGPMDRRQMETPGGGQGLAGAMVQVLLEPLALAKSSGWAEADLLLVL